MWFLAILFIGAIIAAVAKSGSGDSLDDHFVCPHGYDDFGCQPECPLYAECWGNQPDTNRHPQSSGIFNPTIPPRINEDGDWRTVWLDDERYDEREEDELFDEDREDNAW